MKYFLFFFLFSIALQAQTIQVQPFLQDAEPDHITIYWETDSGEESTVEWGLDETLGNTNQGTTFEGNAGSRMHSVLLEGLERFTVYHYRVKTGETYSSIYQFKTPPFSSDNESFRMVAMSDMQRDNSHPAKFNEIVHDGVLDYMSSIGDQILHEDLSLVIIPGDLVVNGLTYSQWKEHFFDPAHPLFAEVPVYPVAGNHENDSDFFFNYFQLPENGTAGYEEHWWYKDYSNVRIIGLDSNGPYRIDTQLDWLDNVLEDACENSDIDFVFAQLHHPHLSELWTPGNTDYTREVIIRLENFTTTCGKPSIHFFGHTHGYSRGQSRDHEHLWVNVATAGGAIDNWDEFPQQDYEEFSVSQDHWGFVVVEVNADEDNSSFTLKRISRGNETTVMDNEETDIITIRAGNLLPDQPTANYPSNIEIGSSCVELQGSSFVDTDGEHGATHWQLSANCDDFTNPIFESWKQHENWYRDEDLQAEDDLTNEQVFGLEENSSYCWRVRYRDKNLGWSEWSEPATFQVADFPTTVTLSTLLNPGAEEASSPWVVEAGVIETLTDGECNGISPNTGEKYYAVGGVCEDGPYGRVSQTVNLEPFFTSIEENDLKLHFGGYLSDYSGSDRPEIKLLLLNEDGFAQDSTASLTTLSSSWILIEQWLEIPEWCHAVQMILIGTRNAGNDNDSYFDDLFLGLSSGSPCDFTINTSEFDHFSRQIVAYPNPTDGNINLELPEEWVGQELVIKLVNTLGQKQEEWKLLGEKQQQINLSNLPNGSYFLQFYMKEKLLGAKQVLKQ